MDTGRSINLMFYFLYNSLANNQEIPIDDIATVTGIIEGNQTSFDVYILKDTSHPLILVTVYLRSNGVIFNFNSLSVNFSKFSKNVPKNYLIKFSKERGTTNSRNADDLLQNVPSESDKYFESLPVKDLSSQVWLKMA